MRMTNIGHRVDPFALEGRAWLIAGNLRTADLQPEVAHEQHLSLGAGLRHDAYGQAPIGENQSALRLTAATGAG